MPLADILSPASVIVPLAAADREAAIGALVEALALPGLPGDREELRRAVLAREQAGSTGIGKGIAIPHARTRRASKPVLAAGRLARPIDFAAADAQPVSLVFLLAVPDAEPKAHLKALAALSRLGADAKLLKALNRCEDAEEFLRLLGPLPF